MWIVPLSTILGQAYFIQRAYKLQRNKIFLTVVILSYMGLTGASFYSLVIESISTVDSLDSAKKPLYFAEVSCLAKLIVNFC